MGMDDREANLGEVFTNGDRFVLTGLRYSGAITTRHGPAEKSLAQIVSRDHPNEKRVYACLGVGYAEQARRAEPSDFPRVVEMVRVPTGTAGNMVKRFAKVDVDPRAFLNGDDGPPVLEGSTEPQSASGFEDGDIPF